MKRLTSINYSNSAFNIGIFILRVTVGALLVVHGYDKLVHFSEMKNNFMNFMNIGKSLSLSLVIFAEFFCSMFLIAGLFTRLVVIPPIIVVAVALFQAHHFDVFGQGEKAALYLAAFLTILFVGPGKISIDGMIK
jgi:putative oxidoreductase